MRKQMILSLSLIRITKSKIKMFHIYFKSILCVLAVILISSGATVFAADIELPGVDISISESSSERQKVSTALKVLVGMTILSVAPAILVMMTSFTRIVIVLSILRHALGMQQTPPNTVIISLALFLTLFNMMPVINDINIHSFQPYMDEKLDINKAASLAMEPIRNFMIR